MSPSHRLEVKASNAESKQAEEHIKHVHEKFAGLDRILPYLICVFLRLLALSCELEHLVTRV